MFVNAGLFVLCLAVSIHARPRPNGELDTTSKPSVADIVTGEVSTVPNETAQDATEASPAPPADAVTTPVILDTFENTPAAEGQESATPSEEGSAVTGETPAPKGEAAGPAGGEAVTVTSDDIVAVTLPTLPPVISTVGEWHKGATYSAGDVVVWDGKRYKALQQHSAYAYNWTPPQAASLWEVQPDEAA